MSNNISLYPVLFVNFIGTLGFSIVLPFLVFLVTKFGGDAVIYGVLGATYPAFQLVGAPILGKWSDMYGRRKVLLLSQAGTLGAWIIFLVALFLPVASLIEVESDLLGKFALTLPLVVLFFSRALDGLTGGNISVANAYLADITEEKDRNKNFGKMAISSNLGFILGPALAGVLGGTVLEETLPVLAAIGISVAATLIVAFYLPESNLCILKRSPEQTNVRKVFLQESRDCFNLEGSGKIKLKDVLAIKEIPFLLLLYFLIYLGFTIFYTAFPFHAAQRLNWSITDLGIYFSVLSGMMVVAQGPVLSKFSKICSDAFLVIVGNLILGFNFILITSSNAILIYAAAVFFAIGNGLMWPSVLSLLSRMAGQKYQGSVQGFAGSFGSLASIIGLIFGGIMYGILGTTTFLISAVIIYLTFFLSFRLLAVEKKSFET